MESVARFLHAEYQDTKSTLGVLMEFGLKFPGTSIVSELMALIKKRTYIRVSNLIWPQS